MNILLRLRTWYKIHKWTSIFTGLLLLMWLITGLLATWEKLLPKPEAIEPVTFNYDKTTLSPADAIANLEENLGKTVEVNWVALTEILDRIVYKISVKEDKPHLVDAQLGQLVEITPEIAEEIAKAKSPTQAPVLLVERINRNDFSYIYGPTPVYRIVFDDNKTTYSHVSAQDGTVTYNNCWSRITAAFLTLHTFQTLKVITSRKRIITGLLWLSTFLTLFAALNGYYLALPSQWRIPSTPRRK